MTAQPSTSDFERVGRFVSKKEPIAATFSNFYHVKNSYHFRKICDHLMPLLANTLLEQKGCCFLVNYYSKFGARNNSRCAVDLDFDGLKKKKRKLENKTITLYYSSKTYETMYDR